MGPIQELKVNMVIYLHARKQAHFVLASLMIVDVEIPRLSAGAWSLVCRQNIYGNYTQEDGTYILLDVHYFLSSHVLRSKCLDILMIY